MRFRDDKVSLDCVKNKAQFTYKKYVGYGSYVTYPNEIIFFRRMSKF